MNKNTHNQTVGSNIERSDERIDQTGEIFTPLDFCSQMINNINVDVLKDPNSTFIDKSDTNYMIYFAVEYMIS